MATSTPKIELIQHIGRLGVYTLICLGVWFLIPGETDGLSLLGLSPVRLTFVLVFLLILISTNLGYVVLKRHPYQAIKIETHLYELGKNSRVAGAILFIAIVVILCGFSLGSEIITDSAGHAVLWLRLLPILVLIIGVGWELLSTSYWGAQRRIWSMIAIISVLLMTIVILAQQALQLQIERDHQQPVQMVYAIRLLESVLLPLFAVQFVNTPPLTRRTWLLSLVYAALLLWLQAIVLPRRDWRAHPEIALWAPVGMLSITWASLCISGWWRGLREDQRHQWNRNFTILAALILLMLALPYTTAAVQHAKQVNTSARATDQSAYMQFAVTARQYNFQYTGDHSRMPVYPFLQAVFYQPGMSEAQFFWQGKMVNIALSLLFLVLLYTFVYRSLGGVLAALLTGIIAFSLYIFKAPYFQAEISYYFLAFLAFAWMGQLLLKPDMRISALAGVVSGLAYLVKASVLPGMVIFGSVYVAKELALCTNAYYRRTLNWSIIRTTLWRLIAGVCLAVCFLIVVFPYIRAMQLRFGQYFYNVNTSFYIWYDSFEQAKADDVKNGFREKYPAHLSEDEIPSLRNYLRTHTYKQIWERLEFGVESQINNILDQFSITNFHLSYMAALVLACLVEFRTVWKIIRSKPDLILFVVLYFAVYLASFAWYARISPERRFTYTLYLPLMYAIFIGLQGVEHHQQSIPRTARKVDLREFVSLTHLLMAYFLVVNIYLVLTERILLHRYGT